MKKIVIALLASGALFMAAGSIYAAPLAHPHTRVHESITIHAGVGRFHPAYRRWRRANWRFHRRVWRRRHRRFY